MVEEVQEKYIPLKQVQMILLVIGIFFCAISIAAYFFGYDSGLKSTTYSLLTEYCTNQDANGLINLCDSFCAAQKEPNCQYIDETGKIQIKPECAPKLI